MRSKDLPPAWFQVESTRYQCQEVFACVTSVKRGGLGLFLMCLPLFMALGTGCDSPKASVPSSAVSDDSSADAEVKADALEDTATMSDTTDNDEDTGTVTDAGPEPISDVATDVQDPLADATDTGPMLDGGSDASDDANAASHDVETDAHTRRDEEDTGESDTSSDHDLGSEHDIETTLSDIIDSDATQQNSDAGTATELPPGADDFGTPCVEHEDCQSGVCLFVEQTGDICTLNCTESCPEGWVCDVLLLGEEGEVLAGICIPGS